MPQTATNTQSYFYPRSPCGERLITGGAGMTTSRFLSTLSLRRATSYSQHVTRPSLYFYPRSPCGERPRACRAWSPRRYFYPRSPCGERLTMGGAGMTTLRFLSTLSLRRATQQKCRDGKPYVDFYPRSPCGERPIIFCKLLHRSIISIHALLAESDPTAMLLTFLSFKFLSTLSLRRATRSAGLWQAGYTDFYPRSPCGERPFFYCL